MNRSRFVSLLALCLALVLLSGCGSKPAETEPDASTAPVIAEPAPTIPADGNPNDVTCKGSYTGTPDAGALVAAIGTAKLTNAQLNAYYWAEVASYRQSGKSPAPDFTAPLDSQVCTADESVASWQQYFLRSALNTWHSARALMIQGEEVGLPVEEAYQPNLDNYELYMKDMPVTHLMYRYTKAFHPNTMHQAYLDSMPDTLEELASRKGYSSAGEMAQAAFGTTLEGLNAFADSYNRGYIYYTNLSYFIELDQEELDTYHTQWLREHPEADPDETAIDMRHILLLPEGGVENATEEQWAACTEDAEKLMDKWRRKTKRNEGSFADYAHLESQDTGSALDGGSYLHVTKGQLAPEIESWCFDPSRASGDITILRTQAGVHILYFSASHSLTRLKAEEDLMAQKQADLLTQARMDYPISVSYDAITLAEAQPEVSLNDILYPDLAHERFPEIPLYLQQDYPNTKYGKYWIRTNGCGITTMAMLASYMTDDELTPPEMCARYGGYSHKNGTDGMLYIYEPPVMGFYLRQRTFDFKEAKQALDEGYVVINVQTKGYWTRGGHYIALEKVNEDGTIQVRDSNIFNYGNLPAHKEDGHKWSNVVANGHGFWVFENKITRIPNCCRCGDVSSVTGSLLQENYLCRKCTPALLRRGSYLSAASGM